LQQSFNENVKFITKTWKNAKILQTTTFHSYVAIALLANVSCNLIS